MKLDLKSRLMGNVLKKNRSHDLKFEDYIKLNDLNEPLELRHDQIVNLGPTIKEGEVIDTPIKEMVKTRHDDDMITKGIEDHPSFSDLDRKIHVNGAYNLRVSCMVGKSIVGAFMNAPIFIGTFSVMTDFAVIEDIDCYRDEEMGDDLLGIQMKNFMVEYKKSGVVKFVGILKNHIYAAGSESHPPMLNKENYVPWSSRLLRYAKSRPNGKLIRNSILNGPYVRRMIPELGNLALSLANDERL
nr:ribonuclease H-like domain-containing protein [Tanacetum cinerariifolium]